MALIVGVSLLLVSVGTIGAAWAISARYEKNIKRADLLGDVPTTTRTDDTGSTYDRGDDVVGPLNFLVLGSDSRLADPSVQANTVGERSDTMMLVHITADLQSAYVVSIPRDSYVEIPEGGTWQGGKNKINAAFSYGGAPLAAKTVYNLTGLPLDGAVVVDFNGVRTMVNAVGGVRVCTSYTVRSIHTDRVWAAGCHHMGGDSALDFMRQRYSVPGSDFGRIHNQQVVLKALLDRAVSGGTLTNPLRFDAFLRAATGAITVDDNMDVEALAIALRGLRPGDLTFETLPYTSESLWTPFGTAVQVDEQATAEMFAAINEDRLPEWQAARKAAATSLVEGDPSLVPSPSLAD
ncbi:LCP family protein [Cryptosporangium aurantiacum]|uniref:Transcriptional attenuator, LytR family n=1 Tax=Cryptosporangium aurantiacum TaxID=134849 RepID=A0A1M7H0Q7_9ACTN|nr:LCP family protein [Cryptosporangium aurantiacum]SHM21926.1 transcriptional attenuator, LytR family [Cryptosporangium aurantiacum]